MSNSSDASVLSSRRILSRNNKQNEDDASMPPSRLSKPDSKPQRTPVLNAAAPLIPVKQEFQETGR